MSGIAGIYYSDDREVRLVDIERMTKSIRHRGPDRQSCWHSANVGLGCAFLESTPESFFENLPYTDQEFHLTITADARIDNRHELFEKLSLRANKKVSDSQLILEAYKKWGEDCANHLMGDFAFVIWDGITSKLFCCRDPIGVRPFFYYRSGASFIFASEIKALQVLNEVPCVINDTRVADYLQLVISNKEYTFYEHIYRLEPSSLLTISDGQITKKTYLSFRSIKPHTVSTQSEYAQGLKGKLFDAVSCRLRTAASVGCQFSGGLDSSAITCVAREILPVDHALYTYSATYLNIDSRYIKNVNEKEYQDSIINEGGFNQRSFDASEMSPLADTDRYLEIMDEPVYYPNMHMSMGCYRLAGEDNIRVMLNGSDGDTVVSHGYEYFTQLFLSGKFFKLFDQVIKFASVRNLRKLPSLRRYIFNSVFRAPIAYLWHQYKSLYLPGWNVNKLIRPAFSKSTDLLSRIQPKWPIKTAFSYHKEMMESPLHSAALEMQNILSSSFGIETRSPFYDRRVVEYCLALPPNQKLNNGITRYVLRESMRDIIPETNRTRLDKANIGIGFCANLVFKDSDRINSSFAKLHPYLKSRIDSSRLEKDWSLLQSDPYQQHNSRYIYSNVYTVFMLNAWLHQIQPIRDNVVSPRPEKINE